MDWNDLNTDQGSFLWSLVKFQPVVQEEMLFKNCGRTDGHTDDDDRRWVITIAHLEPSAQVS